MRVAMYYSNRDIRIQEMPVPEAGPGELLVKVMASGICGSDVMEWYRAHKVPLVLGHEIAGEVAAVGRDVKGYARGDRMSASHHVPCNTCHYCLGGHHTACETLRTTNFYPGGFAEYVRLPAINVDRGVYRLPDAVSYEEATFIEPLACVIRAQQRLHIGPGKTVLVLGSGISGLLHIHLARTLGATRIIATDVDGYRLDAARRCGADDVIPAREDVAARLREKNQGRLADIVIACTGVLPALEQALTSVDRGGTVLFFAPTDRDVIIPLSINRVFWRNDVTLTTSYAGDQADHLAALELIRSRRVRVADMITHRLGLAETVRGFELVAQARDSIKVVIEPQR